MKQIIDRDHTQIAHLIDWESDWERLGLTEDDFNNIPIRARVPVKINRTKTVIIEGIERKMKLKDDPNAKAYIVKYGKAGAEVDALGFAELQRRATDT